MKKGMRALLGAALALSLCSAAGAAEPAQSPEAAGIQVLLDGAPLKFDVPPTVVDGRTLVPFRGIFEALGYEVSWDGAGGVRAVSDSRNLELKLNEKEMRVDGQAVALDAAPLAVEERTLVPVRAVSQASDCDVLWDQEGQTVLLYHRRGELSSGAQMGYAGVCTDGSYLYAEAWQGESITLRLTADGAAEVFPALPVSNDFQYYGGLVYGRFGDCLPESTASLSFGSWDPATGETRLLLDQSVGGTGVWGDHIYFNALSYVDETAGFYRAGLDGGDIVRLGEPLKFSFTLADGLAFSDEGEVRSLETGERVYQLSSGLGGDEIPDFFEGTAVANGKCYAAVNGYRSATGDMFPRGVLVYDYKTGEQELLRFDKCVESIAVTENSIFLAVDEANTWTIYRLTLEGTHPVLLWQSETREDYGYFNEITAIGNYLYYHRGMGALDTPLFARVPMAGGGEEVLWPVTP